MKTPNTTTLPTNIYDLTVFQTLRFVSSSDLDASEFGTRLVKLQGLLAKNNRTEADALDMQTLLRLVTTDYANEAFRQHLQEVLRGKDVGIIG